MMSWAPVELAPNGWRTPWRGPDPGRREKGGRFYGVGFKYLVHLLAAEAGEYEGGGSWCDRHRIPAGIGRCASHHVETFGAAVLAGHKGALRKPPVHTPTVQPTKSLMGTRLGNCPRGLKLITITVASRAALTLHICAPQRRSRTARIEKAHNPAVGPECAESISAGTSFGRG